MYSIFLITCAAALSSLLVLSHTNHVQKRQAFFSLPNFLTIPQLPVLSDQTTAARYQALAGRPAGGGCVYVSVLVDSTNSPLNCRLECQSGLAFPFQLQSVLGQFGLIVPGYLVNGKLSTIDLSSNDTPVGDSYFLYTPPTTTTIAQASVITTTTTASTAVVTTTTSSGTPVTPVTVPLVTTTTLPPPHS
ncbi:hypothetical protein RvY_14741-1 [Ramazzottius varieornatus]|uniref:Uncharacterized protein n=1 Tax=Ramazzottius varieornatus TaxID=947166 RepID=A0A1D1VTZ2_RAMVA|nr:hypothetical protein RvY_14741-1 [Ramazzottius varieornatus]